MAGMGGVRSLTLPGWRPVVFRAVLSHEISRLHSHCTVRNIIQACKYNFPPPAVLLLDSRL